MLRINTNKTNKEPRRLLFEVLKWRLPNVHLHSTVQCKKSAFFIMPLIGEWSYYGWGRKGQNTGCSWIYLAVAIPQKEDIFRAFGS